MARFRMLSATLCTLLLITQAGSVLAQTPPPIERTPEMEERAAEMAALIPDELAGVSLLDNLDINVGQEVIGELDPSDPSGAEGIALNHELAAAVGATLDDAASASSGGEFDEDAYASVSAYQIRGADIQQALPVLVGYFEKLATDDALFGQEQIGDVEVTTLRSGENPEEGAWAFLARGDIIWMLVGPTDFLEEAIRSLPES